MTGGNGRRPYRSDLRARQARETRRAVVAAAADLFVRHGYAATTLDAVADAAGVSRKTVFNAVGGKPALLKLAWDQSLVGDDEPVSMADRPAVAQIVATTDPAEAVASWVDLMIEVAERAAGLAGAVVAAADTDADAAALLERSATERLVGARAFAGHLRAIGGLRDDLSTEDAADLLWALNEGAGYRLLVLERGWSVPAFREWMVRVARASVLGP
ncbi:TetR/AcrR family transcriptional regulator [Pseudonocardia endophytica]|uniref:TetR family transcriptional regulator n=1 Tax=Pseudonocardia endophytica TaxID=401976 RepID=A0A4R1HMM3_PSEEN|nr:TetR/AcrR family transcriptional regulator [Pseudonocardia endophytica]TCK22401.1 TetR family transcriptional regulator [Pseudonocardia endophytica]